jgi:hypothetical protein
VVVWREFVIRASEFVNFYAQFDAPRPTFSSKGAKLVNLISLYANFGVEFVSVDQKPVAEEDMATILFRGVICRRWETELPALVPTITRKSGRFLGFTEVNS